MDNCILSYVRHGVAPKFSKSKLTAGRLQRMKGLPGNDGEERETPDLTTNNSSTLCPVLPTSWEQVMVVFHRDELQLNCGGLQLDRSGVPFVMSWISVRVRSSQPASSVIDQTFV